MDVARKWKVELIHQQKLDILNKFASERPPNELATEYQAAGAAFHASKKMLRICEEKRPELKT